MVRAIPREADVLVIGSGLAGAAVVRRVLDLRPGARVVMVEAGRSLTPIPGMNIRNLSSRQRHAVDAELKRWADEPGRRTRPGTRFLLPPAVAEPMPSAKFSSNVGGMGAHWTCAVPQPSEAERPAAVEPGRFETALNTAAGYLSARTGVYPPTSLSVAVRRIVTDVVGPLPARPVQDMPIACTRGPQGPWWTGLDTVLGRHAAEPDFLLLEGTVCRQLLHRRGHILAVELVDVASNQRATVEARVVVVAADAFRTPQLLWTSQIRPPALGRHLNEHHQIVATVVPPASDDLPLRPHTRDVDERADLSAVLWVPFSSMHPYHGQVMVYEPKSAHPQVGLAWYAPQAPDAGNAVWFDEEHPDPFGMPAPRIRFTLGPSDRARVQGAEQLVRDLAARIGVEAPHGMVTRLPSGSSLHYLGTVRMGACDDGTSVCDANGQVWGWANLFVAGNGVIPGPTACNPTLTAVALAILCGDEVNRALGAIGEQGPQAGYQRDYSVLAAHEDRGRATTS